jgi:geranylgeranyl pyrophosphate synthase
VNFEGFSTDLRPRIEAVLQHQLQTLQVAPLNQAMAHLLGRGKLFRPLLVLAAARAVGCTDVAPLVALATPLELIHTFTLIHDDLPSMDDAHLRRGVTAVHLAFSEATAILAGDALLSWAIYLLASEELGLPPAIRLRLTQEAAFATKEVIEGQMLDLDAEGRHLTLPELVQLHSKKTGALLGACCAIGALLGGAPAETVDALRQFGVQMGLAFQIRDDLLSVQSTELAMGKTLGTDDAKQKSTYPRLLGVAGAEEELREVQQVLEERLAALNLAEPDVLRDMAVVAGQRAS